MEEATEDAEKLKFLAEQKQLMEKFIIAWDTPSINLERGDRDFMIQLAVNIFKKLI